MPPGPKGAAAADGSTPKNAGAGTSGALGRLSELAWQALPAIGSAIGFAGFVAVIGAAIEWIRFDAAHLPATQAVLAVPRQELVIVGALALAAFVVGGVLAVLLVYLIDNNGNATVGTVRGLVSVGVAEMSVTLFFIEVHHAVAYVLLGVWLAIIGLAAAYVVGAVMRNFRSRTKLKRARAKVIDADAKRAAAVVARGGADRAAQEDDNAATKQARTEAHLALLEAQEGWERAIREWTTAANDIIAGRRTAEQDVGERLGDGQEANRDVLARMEAARTKVNGYLAAPPASIELESSLDEAEQELGHAFRAVGDHLIAQVSVLSARLKVKARKALGRKVREALDDRPIRGKPLVVTAWFGAVLAFASIVLGIVLVAKEGSLSWIVIVLGVVAVLATMDLLVARATEKFAWYGVSVFFSVLLFGATLTIAKTLDMPSVQPIALVRKSDYVGVCGVFITQTSDRMYIGRTSLAKHRPGLMFWIPTSDVDVVSVGQLERVDSNFPKLALAMLTQLYKDRAEEAAPALKNTTASEVVTNKTTKDSTTTVTETPPRAVPHKLYPKETLGKDCTSPPTTASPHNDPAAANPSSGAAGHGQGSANGA